MAMPTIMLCIHASVVLLLAHYQVLCYCSLAKPDPQNKSKTLVSQDRYGIVFMHGQNVMADYYSAQSQSFHFGLRLYILILSCLTFI